MSRNDVRFVKLEAARGLPEDTATATGYPGERPEDRPRHETFGLTANPPPGSKGIMICPEGDTERAIFVCFDYYQGKQAADGVGSTRVWDTHGNSIDLHAAGVTVRSVSAVTIEAAAGVDVSAAQPVNVTAPSVDITGNVTITGAVSFNGGSSIDEAGRVVLGGGDRPVARIGDSVVDGVIVSGNSEVWRNGSQKNKNGRIGHIQKRN